MSPSLKVTPSLQDRAVLVGIQRNSSLKRWLLLLLLSRFSRVRLCATPQTATHQAHPSLDSPSKNAGVGSFSQLHAFFSAIFLIGLDSCCLLDFLHQTLGLFSQVRGCRLMFCRLTLFCDMLLCLGEHDLLAISLCFYTVFSR